MTFWIWGSDSVLVVRDETLVLRGTGGMTPKQLFVLAVGVVLYFLVWWVFTCTHGVCCLLLKCAIIGM